MDVLFVLDTRASQWNWIGCGQSGVFESPGVQGENHKRWKGERITDVVGRIGRHWIAQEVCDT